MDLALKEKHYHGGSMFTASAFVSKSRWISSFFPPPSLLQIHLYTGYKS